MRLVPQTMSQKGGRRNKEEIERFHAAIISTIEQLGPPVTLRQLFYALLPLGLYPKTEQAYKNLCYHTMKMRENDSIPFTWFSDNTRWQRKPDTYRGLEDMLRITARTYRRSLWTDLDCYCEVWVEKDALASFFYEITGGYDVPLMVTRGFPSATFVYEAAESINAIGKETFIYYFGDFDPSGVLISQDLERKLDHYGAFVEFTRVAVNREQITKWNLPTRPTKRSGSHAKQFESDASVELDAVPPEQLRTLIENCIKQHLPVGEIDRLQRIEDEERKTLRAMVYGFKN